MTISTAKEFFREIKRHPDRFYIIHYSSQSLYDDNEGLSPRVTSIVVMHCGTQQTVSFSTHSIAEELGIIRNDVPANFDAIERKLLESFFAFIRDRRDRYWVHWNMRNIVFGFELIEHRYRRLFHTDPPSIPVERRINLNDTLKQKFGDDYAKDPRMYRLMDLNDDRHKDTLTGADEVEAFQNREFVRMHLSTLSKVQFFRTVISKALEGRLKTDSRSFLNFADRVLESRAARVTALTSSAIAILSYLVAALIWLVR